MKNDIRLNIATALKRTSKTWKNRKIRWSNLVKKLADPVVTGETLREYELASKNEQSQIKDVGGYFGGYLNKGRRKPANVMHRQLITLDIDYAPVDFWGDFTLFFHCAAVLHATHSHTDKSPRYRLIIPLSEEVTGEQYIAIARKIAEVLGIDYFDDTTFQVHRFMYWASISKDVEYYFEEQKGDPLDVQETLDAYVDWSDASEWCMSSRNVQRVRDASEKQQDPEDKRGVVGVFCRTYSIKDALDFFLEDVYTPTTDANRYTYVNGSTYAGLIVYDDKFAYSHHGTDPASGTLSNAFDLVRRHKFTHMSDKESFHAMEDLCLQDNNVKKTLAHERIELAKYDFAEDLPNLAEEDTGEWLTQLEADRQGRYLSSATNLNLIFDNDVRLKNVFIHNEFDRREYITRSLPWRESDGLDPVRNIDKAGVRNYIECIYGITGVQKINDAFALQTQKNSTHPVREYLNGVEWDQVPRVDTVLVDYFGVTDSDYSRDVARKVFTGAVARIFRPGIKFDLVLMLVGAEGVGKSTFVHKFGRGWSSDTFTTVHGKEAFEQLQGVWLVELAELAAFKKAEVESIKHFVSKQVDEFRGAYKEVSEKHPRQCIFIATTNEADPLRSTTGNRRFLPVDVNMLAATKDIFNIPDDEINQIWAEAVQLFKGGEKLYLQGKAATLAKQEQKEHTLHDDREGLLVTYLDKLLPDDWNKTDLHERRNFLEDPLSPNTGTTERQYVCIAEIWAECLLKDPRDLNRYNTREIHDILTGLPEWQRTKKTRRFPIYGLQKYYERTLF